jgi:hypothetical protein
MHHEIITQKMQQITTPHIGGSTGRSRVKTRNAQSAPNQGTWQSDKAAAARKQPCRERHRLTNRRLQYVSASPTNRPTDSSQPTNSSPQRQIAAATSLPTKIVTAPSDLFDNNKPGDSIFISPPIALAKWDPIKNSTLPTVKQPGREEDCNDMFLGGLTNLLKRQKKQNDRAMKNITPRRKLR